MAASARKTLARNLTLSLQLLDHVVESVICYMAASAKSSQSDAVVTVVCWL
jgi:hypothetical protein